MWFYHWVLNVSKDADGMANSVDPGQTAPQSWIKLLWSGSTLFALTFLVKNLRSLLEPRHDKTNKVSMHPATTQISLGICPVWSESSFSTWRRLGSLATHWVHSEDSDKTGWMPRLIWVLAGRTANLLFVMSRLTWCLCLSITAVQQGSTVSTGHWILRVGYILQSTQS